MKNRLMKFIFGKTKVPKNRKRKLLIFIAACTMFLGGFFHFVLKVDGEGYLLAGFALYTFSEMYS